MKGSYSQRNYKHRSYNYIAIYNFVANVLGSYMYNISVVTPLSNTTTPNHSSSGGVISTSPIAIGVVIIITLLL